MATKKLDVPDIGGLLGKITEKREEMPKAPIQSVQPVEEKAVESKSGSTLKQQNSIPANQPQPQPEPPPRGVGGRPSMKKDFIEYVKISPRIPKALKRDVEHALTDERFKDAENNPIKTLDEIVAYALDQLFVK